VCLGLLVGGLRLGSIVVPQPGRKYGRDFERIAEALRIVGVQLCVAGAASRVVGFTSKPAPTGPIANRKAERLEPLRLSAERP
jgi:hypothetical protein